MSKKIICPDCQGKGTKEASETCDNCHGTGQIDIVDDYGQKRKVKCYPCRGTGKVNDTDTCGMCGGAGEIEV